ncbi:hypothetical protein BYT27DRAFT_7248649 [Phlegmacium glaucopus]|nr:hypothetical protein BYT27DRAFT_7248649 [Phlegmacium glaucopus]
MVTKENIGLDEKDDNPLSAFLLGPLSIPIRDPIVRVLPYSVSLSPTSHTRSPISLSHPTGNVDGRWNEAEQLESQVMDLKEKLTAIREGGMRAEQLEVQFIDMNILLGVEHPDTLKSMENIGSTYNNQGRWGEAEQLNVELMNMKK